MAQMASSKTAGAASQPRELYARVRQQILEHLGEANFAVGERFSTEAELSARFGVSRNTVRKAMELLEAEGYLSRRRGVGAIVEKPALGLAAARQWQGNQAHLAGRHSAHRLRVITVLPRWNDDQEGFFTSRLLRALSSPELDPPLSVEIRHADDPVTFEQAMQAAVVAIDPAAAFVPELRAMTEAGGRVIVLEPHARLQGLVSLDSDRQNAVCQAVKHFYELGHKAVGIINHDPAHMSFLQAQLGYLQAHRELGIPIHPNALIQGAKFRSPDAEITPDVKNITAWVCVYLASVQMVVDACRANHLRVPEDVSLISLDDPGDAPLASLGKAVSVVAGDFEAIARKIHDLLVNWDERDHNQMYAVPPRQIDRETIAAKRG